LIRNSTQPHSCDVDGYVVLPKTLVLGWTVEKVKLPNTSRIGARVEGKSSLARIGLGIHVTAPTIHPGFGEKADDPSFQGSQIRLEIWNISPLKIRLKKGMPICQIIFEEVHGIPEGRYAGQFAIQGPR
jgi:dCTP deaminase